MALMSLQYLNSTSQTSIFQLLRGYFCLFKNKVIMLIMGKELELDTRRED